MEMYKSPTKRTALPGDATSNRPNVAGVYPLEMWVLEVNPSLARPNASNANE